MLVINVSSAYLLGFKSSKIIGLALAILAMTEGMQINSFPVDLVKNIMWFCNISLQNVDNRIYNDRK
ncbi:MAG: hypothetical protein DCF19_03420 [Pseudanabaena frigida]|uniref:Uncharacterized protein n=1 Tax=Pseudanabaena frigida TaxID=945775 RepID=A0A2W4WGI5_9CYAN|nr:MAG: hypothetical protein DCF19_03420 [Pseudanabaena frigida]